jgi:DNA polymerase-3 subunit beta
MVIAFNPRYLLDAARAVAEDVVTLKMTTPLSPCILRGLCPEGTMDAEDAKFLVLPLRVKS